MNHIVFQNNLQPGLDAMMRKMEAREQRYPLGNRSHYAIINVLREANRVLGLDLAHAERVFGTVSENDSRDRSLHSQFNGLLQLSTHPGHIRGEYTDVEHVYVMRTLCAIHLVLFGNLPQCRPDNAEIDRNGECVDCAKVTGASYGLVQDMALAIKRGWLVPGYHPKSPFDVHRSLLEPNNLFGQMYRDEIARGETPYYRSRHAWLRYNGRIPAFVMGQE